MKKKTELIFKKNGASRYYVNGTGIEIQIGKYRDADDFEKNFIKRIPVWAGKYYVEAIQYSKYDKLFVAKRDAEKYLRILINKIYSTKQLKK